jgi:4'-phosphopantetheinyl transferase
MILARYAGKAPTALEFRYGTFGKPALSAGSGPSDLRFNVSHSEDTALYAVAFGREVGIDVERVRDDIAIDDIAARFLAADEQAALHAVPAAQRPVAFFRIWTRKEAILKARGGGLSGSLSGFVVSCDERARLISSGEDPLEASRWRLEDVSLDVRYIAAIAAEGIDWVLRRWEWP